jgi:hypothetical protein
MPHFQSVVSKVCLWSTLSTYMEIHTVRGSPEPPRYLRAISAQLFRQYQGKLCVVLTQVKSSWKSIGNLQ